MSAPRESLTELRFKGIPASPGIAIGPANLFRKATPSIDERAIEAGEVSAETDRLERSLARSRKEIQKILTFAETKLCTEEAKIFEAQLMILEDVVLFDAIMTRVKTELRNVEFIVFDEIEKYRRIMENSGDEYTRERAHDVEVLRNRILRNLHEVTWNDSHFGKKDFYHRIGLKFLDISAENMEELINSLIARINLGDPSELNIPPTLSSPSKILEMNRREKPTRVVEPSQEGKWEVFQQREEETCPESDDVNEEEATQLPQELIHDFQESYTDEQRQNLYEKILAMGVPEKQRLAALANREARSLLIRDPNKMISLNVLKNAKINESEIFHYARRRDLSPDILSAIAQDQKWKKNYPIKFALASNPKTPFSVSVSFVSQLYERELKLLSRDKNVPSVLRRRAQEVLHEIHEK